MNDSMLVVFCLGDKMCCDGNGGGMHLAVCKCSVEAHHSQYSMWDMNVMMCTHTSRRTMHSALQCIYGDVHTLDTYVLCMVLLWGWLWCGCILWWYFNTWLTNCAGWCNCCFGSAVELTSTACTAKSACMPSRA